MIGQSDDMWGPQKPLNEQEGFRGKKALVANLCFGPVEQAQ